MEEAVTTPAWSSLSARGKARVLASAVARVALGLTLIYGLLALLPSTGVHSFFGPVALLLVGVVIYVVYFKRQIRLIDKSDHPQLQAAESMVLIGALFLAIFAAIYAMMSQADPNAFTEHLDHFNAYYFALTILATVGFGDITPTTHAARLVAMVQMSLDLVFLAVVVRLLTKVATRAMRRNRQVSDTD